MKKLIYILSFLTIILIFSCGQNSSEKNLIGKWYGIENDGYTRMQFYPDSLIFSEFDQEIVEWNGTSSKFEFYLPAIISDSSGSPELIEDKIKVNYKLSKNKDTLFGTFVNRLGENKFNLLRAENYIEFLNKKHQIKFSLPEDDSAELIKTDAIYGLNIFMGLSNKEIVGKTELSKNLNNLESDIRTFKDSIKPYEQFQIETHNERLDYRFHLRVFADKSIADSTITRRLSVTIKNKISSINQNLPEELKRNTPDTIPIRIYRIYQVLENQNYGIEKRNDIVKGKEIKTIANTIYDVIATK